MKRLLILPVSLLVLVVTVGAALPQLTDSSTTPGAAGTGMPTASPTAGASQAAETDATAEATDLPLSPLPTLTPSPTLKPPPTFEPPTVTPSPTATPSVTPTSTIDAGFSIEGLNGAETATPTSTPGCEPRDDWTHEYEVQLNDALVRIAEQFGTTAAELAAGNCLPDPNLIVIGQRLRVPGDNLGPALPFPCDTPWEALTPFDGAQTISHAGDLTFNWRGPRAPLNLIRITRPDGSIYERLVERRQNEVIDLTELGEAGIYTWQVFPLGTDYRQPEHCPASPPWTFNKLSPPEQ